MPSAAKLLTDEGGDPTRQPIVGVLGPVAVDVTGDADPESMRAVPGLRARRLLTSLVLADGRTRSAQRLIDDVWGDNPPCSPASALQTQISRLLLCSATAPSTARRADTPCAVVGPTSRSSNR